MRTGASQRGSLRPATSCFLSRQGVQGVTVSRGKQVEQTPWVHYAMHRLCEYYNAHSVEVG